MTAAQPQRVRARKGVFEEKNGQTSAMRVMSFIALFRSDWLRIGYFVGGDG